MDVIIDRLHAANVTARGRARVAKETRWRVLHRIEAEAIALGFAHHPHRRTDEVRVHIFNHRITVCSIKRSPRTRDDREIRVHVVSVTARLAQEGNLVRGVAFGDAEVFVHRTAFVREINQTRQRTMLYLPEIPEITDVIPIAERAVGLAAQMEILHGQTRIKIRRRAAVVTGNVKAAMIHDIVEIHAQSEAMRCLDHELQLCFRAVTRRNCAALIFVAKIKRIKQIVTDREHAPGFGRRRQPETRVTRLGDFRHLGGEFVPVHVEQLKHSLAPHAGGN